MSIIIKTRNDLNNRLDDLTRFNETDISAIARYRMMDSTDTFAIHQIDKATKSIETRSIEITAIHLRLLDLADGADEILTNELRENAERAKAIGEETILMKKDRKIKVTTEDKEKSKSFHKLERQGDRDGKKWIYRSAQFHFDKWQDKLPEWMSREIERMPCNQGYIWKDIYCWGKQPPRGNKSNLNYEIKEARKGLTVIIRWDKNVTRVYHKKAKMNEVLISTTPRKKKM